MKVAITFLFTCHVINWTDNVNCTHTSTRAAFCEFLRMISFSLTFLSACEGKTKVFKKKLFWHRGQGQTNNFIHRDTHTLSLKASNSLSVIFHGVLCLSSWTETPSCCSSYSLKGATLSTNLFRLRSSKNTKGQKWVCWGGETQT